ncbi:VWA containing CoxE family protein, partial [Mesorhizobium sp. M2E.F.Ca.ET.154.01.1.1]
FQSYFYGNAAALAEGDADEETRIKDDSGASDEETEVARREEGGELSSASEQLGSRDFRRNGDGLDAFRRKLAAALPARRSFRTMRTRSRGSL